MKYYVGEMNIRLSESPMTHFVFSSIQEILSSGKSVILEFPTNFGDLSLMIANEYVYSNKKTTIIFSNPETIVGLNDDYYFLMEESIPLRLRAPIGIQTDTGVKIKVVFPKGAKKSTKGMYSEYYKKALMSSEKSIIILASDAEFIDLYEGELLLDEFKKPSLAIFNNTLSPPEGKLIKMITWCKENNLQYLVMTNYLSPNYYKKLEKESIIIPLHNGLLRELSTIDESIGSIFKTNYYRDNSRIISKFSFDQPFHYTTGSSVEYVEIDNGSVLVRCVKDMSQILRTMDIKSLLLKHEILQLVNIGYESINSFIPIDAQTRYSEDIGARINGKGLCDVITKLAENTDNSLREKVKQMVRIFLTIWSCLDRCRSPLYDRGYSKDNKFSKLVDEIQSNLANYDKIYVLLTNKQEQNQLNKLLRSIFPDDLSKIVISTIVNINEDSIEKAMAILPGNPKLNELYVLNYPFERIKILAYHDDNIEFVRDLISLYTHIDGYRGNVFSESIAKAVKEVPAIQKHLSNVPSIEKYVKETHIESTPVVETDVMKTINTEVVKKYPDLNDFLKEIDSYERIKKKYDDESVESYVQNIKKSSSYYVLELENPYTGQHTTIYSSLKTTHPFYVNNELVESTITEEMKGEIIVKALDNHNNLLEMLLDLYGLKDKIDYEIVNIWDECILSYEKSDEKSSSLYLRYRSLGGTKQKQTVYLWFNRKLMGPNDKRDLEIIGKALENKDLTSNADYIFNELERIRNYKRSLGRRLNRIIASIIQHEQINNEDPFTEMIRENVKNYLFVVKQIRKIEAGM